ncbi:hypothetical protein B0H94_11513 [Salsuginibacillus halophilus]|uniref:Uncharacterized protein n=1 Tax=Salsuginibacillus halophilus TaxID=517424 RepID=A0A2P8H8A0_9BACI|nr:hypothetical protein [Salsuginibacillus halophilus]PSL42410.1 hypothetical protein B0H94_11513 [Salsuginibacillus halophilus]
MKKFMMTLGISALAGLTACGTTGDGDQQMPEEGDVGEDEVEDVGGGEDESEAETEEVELDEEGDPEDEDEDQDDAEDDEDE